MNYQLELKKQETNSKILYNTILFDSFKVNIVERYTGQMKVRPRLCEVLFKVRTLDNDLIKRKDGNVRIKIKGDHFEVYQKLAKELNSYHPKNGLANRKDSEQDYVHFILMLVISNYELN